MEILATKADAQSLLTDVKELSSEFDVLAGRDAWCEDCRDPAIIGAYVVG